ncbi:hypothetical protein N8368_04035 [Bacteroidia bacterium]|nr:hypothetical protein [Bacteroidia bacterium]MDB9883293.1 hypothetical protein [Bacteroidia bacterium]MDC1395659.1 hypothetical protein [Bacteroidia bacterium]
MIYKVLFFIITLSTFSVSDITGVRQDFHNLQSDDQVMRYLDKYKSCSAQESIPYLAAARMQRAKYAFYPHKKIEYFNTGKEKIDSYIKLHPACVEGRYVRLLVQSSVPSFLGYSGNKGSDKSFILANISASELPAEYKKTILKNINTID